MSNDDPITPEEMQRIADELRERIRQKFAHVLSERQGLRKNSDARSESAAESDDGIFES